MLYNNYGENYNMNKFAIKLINFYKRNISPNTNPTCRYTPTCSQYGLECFMKFGFLKAMFLTLIRIIKCTQALHVNARAESASQCVHLATAIG